MTHRDWVRCPTCNDWEERWLVQVGKCQHCRMKDPQLRRMREERAEIMTGFPDIGLLTPDSRYIELKG